MHTWYNIFFFLKR